MKKLIGVIVLCLFAAAVLLLLPGKTPEETGGAYDHYFRDNTEHAADEKTICYVEPPYDQARGFSQAWLLEQGMIPEPGEFNNFSGNVMYYEDGSIYEISLFWQNYEGDSNNYKQLSMDIWPVDAADSLSRDGVVVPEDGGVTETEVGGITVIGVGTVERQSLGEGTIRNNSLIFEKDGMRYQIHATHDTTLEEMGAVLDFYLNYDLNPADFAMENGDQYDHVNLLDYPEAFSDCIPDPTGLPLLWEQAALILRNGAPYCGELHYTYMNKGENQGTIYLTLDKEAQEDSLGLLQDLTEEEILLALEQTDHVCFQIGDSFLRFSVYNGKQYDLALELIKTLPGYPQGEATDYSGLFGENLGVSGEYLWSFCGNSTEGYETRQFQDRWGTLLENQVLPAIPGAGLESLTGYYHDQTLKLLVMNWTDMTVYVYPPRVEPWDSYYEMDEKACTRTEINGVTIFGDGTNDGEEKALAFTLMDGSRCYIVTTTGASTEAMGTAAAFFIEKGLDYEAFGINQGDKYEYVGLENEDAREFMTGAYPEVEGIGHISVEIKNGEIIRGVVSYEVHPGKSVLWTVYPEHLLYPAIPLSRGDVYLGDVRYVTETELAEAMEVPDCLIEAYLGEKVLHIQVDGTGLQDELMEMFKSLR